MKLFDIAPFALPNTEPGVVRFEEARDIVRVVVTFKKQAPRRIGLSYLRKHWPDVRSTDDAGLKNPFHFGWVASDDWFNGEWQKAAVTIARESTNRVSITFRKLTHELPAYTMYDVVHRHTLGLRIDVADRQNMRKIAVFTASPAQRSTLSITFDAGRRTPGATLRIDGYNAAVHRVRAGSGTSWRNGELKLSGGAKRSVEVDIEHMAPSDRYAGDDGHVRFILPNDSFTVSLPSMQREGPVWFREKGCFIRFAGDATTFADYRAAHRGAKTIAQKVLEHREQTFAGPIYGQPRSHVSACTVGCRHARQRFWIEPIADIVLHKTNITYIKGRDTKRYACAGQGRFFFGLEDWQALARAPDPAPALVYTMLFRKRGIELEYEVLAVPLDKRIDDRLAGDDTIVCLARFRLRNVGDAPEDVSLPIRFSQNSGRAGNAYDKAAGWMDDWLVPRAEMERLTVRGKSVFGRWRRKPALRCVIDSAMRISSSGDAVRLTRRLKPGASCEALLRIPYIALDTKPERAALERLRFDTCRRAVRGFWKSEAAQGAEVRTPIPHLDELHASHVAHVQVADVAMPDNPWLVNTSVGTSTYGNFTNESCMINQELEQRGLSEDARRRLELWVAYQGTVAQPGNFTDYDGMYYGAGGFQMGHYNQHHGWALWRLAEHFLYTKDRKWFATVVDSVIAGADWVFRQRRGTMTDLPHSRGWEYGFLPAGSLEDVTDFYYWLSTNTLTWRGTDTTARALEAIGHADAGRVRREADAYARDLRRGFETARQHSPLVRLRDGRWVPHYPSRLYCRGRDTGWIREVLEGSVYLMLSGLYDSNSRQAGWILDDFQDNRYMTPPYGYPLVDAESEWFDRGGFSPQPNLLAGLLPHLDRDEPEIYIWMFFNAWAACYRQESNSMVEHPCPGLGFGNSAIVKTSDQANAVMWLRYLFTYWNDELIHVGRAMPREWLASDQPVRIRKLRTIHGRVDAEYMPGADGKRIALSLKIPRSDARVLARFRHPEKKVIRSVRVNGRSWRKVDRKKSDVDLTGLFGMVSVEARF